MLLLFRSSTVLVLAAVALSCKPSGALAYNPEELYLEFDHCYYSNNCNTTCADLATQVINGTCEEIEDMYCSIPTDCCPKCATLFNSAFTCRNVQFAFEYATREESDGTRCPPYYCGDEPRRACADEAIAALGCIDSYGNYMDVGANLCQFRDDTRFPQCASKINAYLDCHKPNPCAYCPGDPTAAPGNAPSSVPSAVPSSSPTPAPSAVPSSRPTPAPSGAPSRAPTDSPTSTASTTNDEEDSIKPSEPLPITVILFVPRAFLGAILAFLSFFGLG